MLCQAREASSAPSGTITQLSSFARRLAKMRQSQLKIWRFQQELGKSTLDLTPIGLGAWAIGGDWRFGWGHQDDADSIATIRHAVDIGLNWIDTAAVYGLGHSEEMVGRALATCRASRGRMCSRSPVSSGMTQRNVFHSLRALIDSPGSRAEPAEAADGAHRSVPDSLAGVAGESGRARPGDHRRSVEHDVALRDEGKVAFVGVSNFDVAQLQRISRIETPTSLQPPYSMLRPEIEADLLPYCAGAQHRRDSVFTDAVGAAHRNDDA